MRPLIKTGRVLGTGAAINIECGFIPDFVSVQNVTDGDKEYIWHRGSIMAFTSGGVGELLVGDTIRGATNTNVTARVAEIHLKTGTWAGGDAAGDLVLDEEVGTFGSENVDLVERADGVSQTNIATVTAQAEKANWDDDTALASTTGNAAITPYNGVQASNAKGFTIGSTISEDDKLLSYVAMRAG